MRTLYDAVQRGLPDMAKVYRGHDGIREFWLAWLAAWETLEFNLPAVEDRGDLVIFGVAVDFHYFQAFAVDDGKVTAVYAADTKAEALAAAGVSE